MVRPLAVIDAHAVSPYPILEYLWEGNEKNKETHVARAGLPFLTPTPPRLIQTAADSELLILTYIPLSTTVMNTFVVLERD